jgi:hypothetical protein
MASTFAASSVEGKEVGVLMEQGNSDPIWLGHEDMAEGNRPLTVDGESSGDGHSPPFKCWDIAHGMGIAGFEQ